MLPVQGRILDGKPVDAITAYLFHAGGHEDPIRLHANSGLSFIGVKPTGQGFSFDDANVNKGAWPLVQMTELLAAHPRNRARIRPYLDGEDLNDSPIVHPRKFIIDLNDLDLSGAREWPELLALVEARVKPARLNGRLSGVPWWQFERARPELTAATARKDQVLICSQTSKFRCFVFAPAAMVFDQKLVVLALDSFAAFSVVESRIHQAWALFLGSTMKDDPVYTPSDCFETFPFPAGWRDNAALQRAGEAYNQFRAALMVRNNEGLTKTYNRFHDPDETDSEIVKLRELHAAMDRAILDAYEWTDIQPTCRFLLEYEDDERDEGEPPGGRRKKRPWRYRWQDDVRDQVLVRLLELNAKCAKEQAGTRPPAGPGTPSGTGGKSRGYAKGAKKAASSGQGGLFGEESD
jgi:hypothetical protein